jgi:hypothetical protein
MRIALMTTLGTIVFAGSSLAAENLDAVWQGILDNPPSLSHMEARNDALKALDKRLMEPDSELAPDVIAYYQRAVDRVLDTLASERVEKGLRLFQLYSSSVIVQTPETVFAIDLDQGPNKNMSMTASDEGTGFRMKPEQLERLVRLVHISFHTHEHYDHVDFELARAFCNAGKTVVVTESNKERWKDEPWAEKLVTLNQTIDKPEPVGNLAVDVLWDHQWNNEEHTSGTPCNAYLITTPGGMSVLSKGDINCGLRLYGWLSIMVENGRHVDLITGTPLFWRGVNNARAIDALLKPVWAIGHVWEFTHRSPGESGGATGTYTANFMMTKHQFQKGTPVVLSWGEYLDLPPTNS